MDVLPTFGESLVVRRILTAANLTNIEEW